LRGEFVGLAADQCVDHLLAFASDVERLGFDSVWLYDHLLPVPPSPSPSLEAWTSLAGLAHATKRVRLGTMVTSISFRNPAHLAKMASTLDGLSGGRLEFGLGAGWYEEEHRAFGYPFPSPGERSRRLSEGLQVILKLWTGDRTTFTGEYFSTRDAWCWPRPVQSPHPRVWVGGRGERITLRVAATYADAWNLSGGSIDEFRAKSRVLEKWCETASRDPASLIRSLEHHCVIVDGPSELARIRRQYPYLRSQRGDDSTAQPFIGRPADVKARIEESIEAGVSYFVFSVPDAELLSRLAATVLD